MSLANIYYGIIDKIPHRRWNEFIRTELEITDNVIQEILDIHRHDAKEQKYQVLKAWEEKQGGSDDCTKTLLDIVNKFLCTEKPPASVPSQIPIIAQPSENDGGSASVNAEGPGAGEVREERHQEAEEIVDYLEERFDCGQKSFVRISGVNLTEQAPTQLKSAPSQIRSSSSPTRISQNVKDFIEYVNEGSKRRCKQNISKHFDGQVRDPSSIVNPVMAETNFFGGGSVPGERNYTVKDERASRVKAGKGKETVTQLEDIHVHGRYIFITGSAGSGKTTLVMRYVEMVIGKDVEQLKDVKMAHLVNIRDVSDEKVTPKDMLFKKFLPGKSKCAIEEGYSWLQEEYNQRSILLAFDGLDTVPWDMRGDIHKSISYDDLANADTIMFNILNGHLFKNCWILVTAREYAIAQFPSRIRPDAIIAIKGLTRASIEILVKDIAGNRGEEIWKDLQSKSSYLMLLCANPLFLILTVIIRMAGKKLPDNLSGTILELIQSHLHSENAHIATEDIDDILEKLENLALAGLEKGKVVFSKRNFEDFQLKPADVEDLFISAPDPGKNVYKQKIVEKDYAMFFCHQAFQEALGALAVARKKYSDFKKFVDGEIHEVYFTVVRQMLCGILFAKNVCLPSGKYKDVEKKRSALLKSFEKALKNKQDLPMDLLNLLISLRECGNNEAVTRMVRKCLPKIDISGIPLSLADLHAIAAVARQCEKLDIMKLVDSHLSDKGLEVLADEMVGSDTEITVFDVSFNANLRKQSMANLYDICRRGSGLNYWQCGFKQRDILDFNSSAPKAPVVDNGGLIGKASIKKEFNENGVLELSHYNVETHRKFLLELAQNKFPEGGTLMIAITGFEKDSPVDDLCEILQEVKCANGLVLSHCELDVIQLRNIRKAIANLELESFNIFLNEAADGENWNIFGSIMKQCRAKLLFLTACSLTNKKLRALLSHADGCSLSKLDVSRNEMDKYAMEVLGDFIAATQPNELIMGYCGINKSQQLRALRQRTGRTKLHRLDMSGNNKMGEDGFTELGLMVDQCKVKQLDASECDPSASEMRSFKEAASNAKLRKLNVSRNRKLGDDGLQEVGEIGRICHVEELFVRQCGVKESSLRRFQKGLGNAKIRSLDFGRYFMKQRPTTNEEVRILAELMRNVTELLTLNDWDIREEDRRYLVKALQELPPTKLKVMFNRGRNDCAFQDVTTPSIDS